MCIRDSYSGIASAIIPVVLPSDAYRIRVVSTSPVYVSKPFPVNIAIGQMPIAVIYNTGPACVNNFAQIGYSNFSHFTEVRWSRWGGAVFSKLQHYPFQHVPVSYTHLDVYKRQTLYVLLQLRLMQVSIMLLQRQMAVHLQEIP